jgi:hypothetical protein
VGPVPKEMQRGHRLRRESPADATRIGLTETTLRCIVGPAARHAEVGVDHDQR